jgi:hypothetical protein
MVYGWFQVTCKGWSSPSNRTGPPARTGVLRELRIGSFRSERWSTSPNEEGTESLKMARSAHAYVRGSTVKFYEWLKRKSARFASGGPGRGPQVDSAMLLDC